MYKRQLLELCIDVTLGIRANVALCGNSAQLASFERLELLLRVGVCGSFSLAVSSTCSLGSSAAIARVAHGCSFAGAFPSILRLFGFDSESYLFRQLVYLRFFRFWSCFRFLWSGHVVILFTKSVTRWQTPECCWQSPRFHMVSSASSKQ